MDYSASVQLFTLPSNLEVIMDPCHDMEKITTMYDQDVSVDTPRNIHEQPIVEVYKFILTDIGL